MLKLEQVIYKEVCELHNLAIEIIVLECEAVV